LGESENEFSIEVYMLEEKKAGPAFRKLKIKIQIRF
jgi:hypothetical protein